MYLDRAGIDHENHHVRTSDVFGIERFYNPARRYLAATSIGPLRFELSANFNASGDHQPLHESEVKSIVGDQRRGSVYQPLHHILGWRTTAPKLAA